MAAVVYKVGDNVSTDTVYPGRFMATVLPSETPQFCFADDKAFNTALQQHAVAPGSIIVGGQNFGCGSSREQAASTIKGHGLVVVARGFARIFLQNAINLGLRTIICPAIEAEVGDELALAPTHVRNVTRGADFPIVPLPAARQAIIDAGGLVAYTRSRLVAEGTR
ncbi:MAG: 3-isopropylmalate dehydratase small subunit [Vicinamibacterales bacterium]